MKAPSVERGRARYYPLPEGGDLPSVTTLLDVIGSRALMGWAAKNGTAKLNILRDAVKADATEIFEAIATRAERSWLETGEITDFWSSGRKLAAQAADYGTLAHAWIEAYLKKANPDLKALPEPARRAVEGFLEWEKSAKLKVLSTERTFYNRAMGYAGTADIVCELDGKLSLGDWKTANGIYETNAVQAWAYAIADEIEHADRLYHQVFIGRFGKDGSWEVRLFERNGFPGYELSRELIQACVPWFHFKTQWEKNFPYKKENKIRTEEKHELV